MRTIRFPGMPSPRNKYILLLLLILMISNMQQRYINTCQTLPKNAPLNPLRRQLIDLVEQPAEGEGDAVGKENLVILVLEFILELQTIILHHVGRHLLF